MRDIWEVLLQTLTVSVTGAYLLLVKRLFKDKLPPIWQFSVWSVLLFSLILPAYGGGILSFITETTKTLSAGEYSISAPVCFFPLISDLSPLNFFDILFLIYVSGVAVFLAKYIFSYIRLRSIIKNCPDSSEENKAIIEEIASEYSLTKCRAVTLKGLSSPFVCGIIKPVMVLPQNTVDKKIILHELLHLKYKDIIFGTIICIFRCIHWFNPFLQYCFNIINNDIEVLCDSRVIERLDGEERRDYGNILLSMANEKYASFPGTSSAANGGKNIRSRIEALVRFKNYPVGNAFISVCITIILGACLLIRVNASDLSPYIKVQHAADTGVAMAAARSNYCTTPAGALDSYGKAVTNSNGIYRALCAPIKEHEELSRGIESAMREKGRPLWDTGLEGNAANGGIFYIYNFLENADGSYNADMIIEMSYHDPDEDDNKKLAVQKLHIFKENMRWVVVPISDFSYTITYKMQGIWGCEDLPGIIYKAETDDFTVEYNYQICSQFSQSVQWTRLPLTSADFETTFISNHSRVIYKGSEENKKDITKLGLSTAVHKKDNEMPEFNSSLYGSFHSTSNQGTSVSSSALSENWGNTVSFAGGGYTTDSKNAQKKLPECIAAGLYVNGELTDELILTREGAQ